MDLFGLLIIPGAVAFFAGVIMCTVAAFRISAQWGLAFMFVPFANFVFWYRYWPESRAGVLVLIGACVLIGSAVAIQPATFQQALVQPGQPVEPLTSVAPQQAEIPPTEYSALTKAIRAANQAETKKAKPRRETTPRVTKLEEPVDSEILPEHFGDYVGQQVQLNLDGGQTRIGVIRKVDEHNVILEQPYIGGSMEYSVPLTTIQAATLAK